MKVSIITVCYNSVKTIEKAILSVLNQDYDKIEYIIIDGGSTDGTLDVIKKYSERISKIISEPDDGIYDAMNKGIRLSTGNIIGIINSDDWYAEGTVLAAVNAFLEDSERDVVHGRQIDVLQDGSLVEHGVKGIMSDDYIATFCHPTFFVKRKVYEENGVFDCQYPTDADGDLVYRLYLAGVKFHYDDSVCAFFRIGTGASSTEAAATKIASLGLSRYITVNFGNGSCKDGSKIAKTWPIKKFNAFVKLFKQRYNDIQVVQLGSKDAERIAGGDKYILGESFELVTHVLQNSMLHVDIEGGLVHLATQLGTKCVVLFGPTPEFYYGYEENINIKVGNCHDCYGIYLVSNRCARGMEKPECMYNITPEIVMDRVEEYFDDRMM